MDREQAFIPPATTSDHGLLTPFQRPDRLHDPLYVVTTVFNATRYRSRWRLYYDFAKRVREAGAVLYTVELAFGDRDFAVTQANDPYDIQVRTNHEIWYKENLINIGVSRLPSDWKYVAWIDADISFVRDDWANETIHLLQHYKFLQMFSQVHDLSPNHEVIGGLSSGQSFADAYMNGAKKGTAGQYYMPGIGHPGAPGYSWACTRQAWDEVGGLIDYGILGAADWHMAHALVGRLDEVMRKGYAPAYKGKMREWQARAHRFIRRNLGVMPGIIYHHWHGHRQGRRYSSRDEILTRWQYNPNVDLKRDWQGVYQLTGRSIGLRDDIRGYFRQRDEDSICIYDH